MNKKSELSLGIVAVVVLLLGGVVGYVVGSKSSDATFGTTINMSNALNQQRLFNDFNSITQDLQNVRATVAGVAQGTTASIDFPTFNASSSGQSTTTQVTGLAGAVGDLVLVSPVTGSSSVAYAATVNVASTTSATFEIDALNATTTAVNPPATTFYLTVIPHASFVAPAALNTTTSTNATST